MIIVECSQARVLFVSDAIADVLHESEDEWIGSCFYDLLHPKDIQKVKEQLACFDVEEGECVCGQGVWCGCGCVCGVWGGGGYCVCVCVCV